MDYMNTTWTVYNNYFYVQLNVNMITVFVLFHSDARVNVARLSVAAANCRRGELSRLTVARLSDAWWSVA